MLEKRIFIRTEGNEKIGLGHLIRSLTLGRILQDSFDITVVCRDVPAKFSLEEYHINGDLKIIEQESEFLGLLGKDVIVVVDGYEFEQAYFRMIKPLCYKVVSIQDIYHYSANIDLVINHLPESDTYYESTEVLSGPKYAIVRKEFLAPRSQSSKAGNYFISLGGTHNFDVINRIVNILNLVANPSCINILTTEYNKERIFGTNCSVHCNKSATDIRTLIDDAAFCFITSGMVLYEVLSRNRSAIVGSLNDGQDRVGKQFERLGLAHYIGEWKDATDQVIINALTESRPSKTITQSIFDGESDKRILGKFLEL